MTERKLPASIEAEQGCLGCIMLSPNECLSECIARFKPGHEVFYDLKHQTIFQAMVAMSEAKEAIDEITLHQRLKDSQQLESAGGLSYIAALPDKSPSPANLSHYIGVVLGKYVQRKMLEYCSDFTDRVYEQGEEIEGLMDEFESEALKIRDSITSQESTAIKELVKDRITFYEECLVRGGGLIGLSTGFIDLDRMTDGLKPGDMVVLAARPSMGKTSLAMNIAENVAIDSQIPVGIFSLEMSKEQLVGRMICSRGRVNERSLTRGISNLQEQKNTFSGAVKVANAPIFIDDTAGLTITQLKARARRMYQRHKVKMLVIDYVQLMRSSRPKANRQEEIAEISTGIKQIAKELKLPVIAICQLNRELEKDKERKPRMSDLRESGQLEQDADIIGMLYATDPAAAASGQDVLAVNLLIAKQRNGPTGDVPLTFFKNMTRFESAAKFEQVVKQPPKNWIPTEE